MRSAIIILTVLAGSSGLLLGCASRQPCQTVEACRTIDVAPSPEELPEFKPRESTICATVAVEGCRRECRPGVVPDFKEPELTPQEKEALCIKPEVINWLEFYCPKPLVTRVSPDLGGPAIGIWGCGGDISAVGLARLGMLAGPLRCPVSGASLQAVCIAEAGCNRPPVAAVGLGEGGASVGEDRATKVAEHTPLCDP